MMNGCNSSLHPRYDDGDENGMKFGNNASLNGYAWIDGHFYKYPGSERYKSRQFFLQTYKFRREVSLSDQWRDSLKRLKGRFFRWFGGTFM